MAKGEKIVPRCAPVSGRRQSAWAWGEEMPQLRRLARILARDEMSTADLIQETVLRALTYANTWEEGEGELENFSAWLRTIMRNCHRRMRVRAAREATLLGTGFDAAAAPAGQEAHLACAEALQALASLPAAERRALSLSAIDGLDAATIARIMGVSPHTVYCYVTQARRRLNNAVHHTQGMRRDVEAL